MTTKTVKPRKRSQRDATESAPDVNEHKLFAPKPVSDMVPRKALLDALTGAPEARVMLLQGPAGHGKTISLIQLKQACEARGDRTAWLTLDEADNEPRRFFAHLRAMVQRVNADAHSEPIQTRVRRHSDWTLEQLSAAPRAALFIDEFQAVTAPVLQQFFRELMAHLPDHITLFIGSRSLPEVGLTRLIIDGRARVLPAEALRFSRDELRLFFESAADLAMRPDELDSIYRRTDGWPAALQLFRLSLSRSNVRAELDHEAALRPRELADYLTDNVLASQSSATRAFLLRTSLLVRLSAPLCEAITGMQGAQGVLESLERNGLFLRALDSELRWFRYHGLFATCLAEQFSVAEPEAAQQVHRQAAQWFAEEEMWAEALHHALAAGERDLAADTLDNWATSLVAQGLLITLSRWAQQLPVDDIVARPTLTVKVAYAYIFLHQRAHLKPLMQVLYAMPHDGPVNPDIVLSMAAVSADNLEEAFALARRAELTVIDDEGFDAFERGAAANLAAFRAISLADFERARQLLSLAQRHNDRGVAAFSRGYTAAMMGVRLMLQGALDEALILLEQAVLKARPTLDRALASSVSMAVYIWALYEADQLDAAEALFEQHQDIIAESALLDFAAVAYLAMARIDDVRGRRSDAQTKLDALEGLAQANGWSRLLRQVSWERAGRSLVGGHLVYARSLAGSAPPLTDPAPEWISFADDFGDAEMGEIRLTVHSGRLDKAMPLLKAAMQRAQGRTYRQIRIKLLETAWHQQAGSERAALAALGEALVLAAPGGYVRCVAESGKRLLPLLQQIYRAPPAALNRSGEYVARLIRALGGDVAAGGEHGFPVESLTEREQAILQQLAIGASNKEMARTMTVSENTVKFHLKNIYAKLSVDNRLRAIAAARERGLIS